MADLVLINASVWTGNPRQARAEAVAMRGDNIYKVGTTREIRRLAGAGTAVVDLEGALVLPGFIDSHTHFLAGGFALKSLEAGTPGAARNSPRGWPPRPEASEKGNGLSTATGTISNGTRRSCPGRSGSTP